MYKDLITYKLADEITHEHLLEVAQKVRDSRMSKQDWCLWREITTDSDGEFHDIVTWNSKEDAEKANTDMPNADHAQEWFACYDMSSIKSSGVTQKASFSSN